jgi:DNA mismatch repair protein MutS
MGIVPRQRRLNGIAICDLSTGQFEVEELGDDELKNELVRIGPAELLVPEGDENADENNLRRNYHTDRRLVL